MAVNFKERLSLLRMKDMEPLSVDELKIIKVVEDYIDGEIIKKLTTDNKNIWIDKCYVEFNYNPISKKAFVPSMTNTRKHFLTKTLLDRYLDADWEISWHIDDGLEGNMSGGDYLILKGKI